MRKIHLLVIDPQNDFCDPKGALFVKGADADMKRLANLVGRTKDKLVDIHVTLDSHQPVHIAHPIFWVDSSGNHPNPFTLISVSDVENGIWVPSKPSLYKRGLKYVQDLAKNKKYVLCIWPPHCLIGTWGQAVVPELYEQFRAWSDRFAIIDFVTKGSNPFTEHYSPFQADVIDPTDPSTALNTKVLDTINEADEVLLAGEAGSHCLANAGRDAATYFSNTDFVKKLVLLEDATSPVTGFENLQSDFVTDMRKLGMRTTTTLDYLA
jgi:nicotinamidase-related amidase